MIVDGTGCFRRPSSGSRERRRRRRHRRRRRFVDESNGESVGNLRQRLLQSLAIVAAVVVGFLFGGFAVDGNEIPDQSLLLRGDAGRMETNVGVMRKEIVPHEQFHQIVRTRKATVGLRGREGMKR